jgi:hypothetical protein
MDSRHCGYCNEYVDLDLGPHVHDPKVCAGCHREFPASGFPPHRSSCDGRRMRCADCSAALRAEQGVRQAADRAAGRDAERALLRKHGYRWVPRPRAGGERGWALLDPAAAEVSKDDALTAIYAAEDRDREYPDW